MNKYLINVYCLDNLYQEYLTNSIIKIGNTLNCDINIVGYSGEYEIEFYIENNSIYYVEKKGAIFKKKIINVLKLNEIIVLGKNSDIAFLVVLDDVGEYKYTFDMIDHKKITLGKSSKNNIVIFDNIVSSSHLSIERTARGQYKITDLNSTNGMYYLGKKIKEHILSDNEKIFFCGKYISIKESKFILYVPEKRVEFNGISSKRDINLTLMNTKFEVKYKNEYPYYFLRSPRLLPSMPNESITIEKPPSLGQKPNISWLQILLPPIITGATTYAGSFMMQGLGVNPKARNLMLIIAVATTALTSIISIITYIKQVFAHKKGIKLRKEKYISYLNSIKADVTNKIKIQKESLTSTHPQFEKCIDMAINKSRDLWNRTPLDKDFLEVSFGIGSIESQVKISFYKQSFQEVIDPLYDEAEKIFENLHTIENQPIVASLKESKITGMIGNRKDSITLMQSISSRIATHHSYDEVKLVYIYNQREDKYWNWARWLPHVWDDEKKIRFIANNKESVKKIFLSIIGILKERYELKSGFMATNNSIPHFIFFIGDINLIQNEPILQYLFNDICDIGVSTICLFDRIELLPKECNLIIESANGQSKIFKKDNSINIRNSKIENISLNDIDYFARKLAPYRLNITNNNSALPLKITFNEMLNIDKVSELNIVTRWQTNEAYKALSAPVGKLANGDLMYMDLHEKGFGPHGLVAGTTGSGKSEMLQSLLLSLAVNYHPHDLVFLVIDYKGGGMANFFVDLPHLVGTITNLSGNDSKRALLSIKSEISGRQRKFNEFGVNNIDNYMKLYKEGVAKSPLPHMVIIVDEFAELKQEQPDFMRELVSTARVGRSLGMHLILATQKPSGVVDDQIWSNSKFKLCLKVQDASDSNEILKKPDAANIKNPGRCYIQVGNNELYEQFQSAWSGALYNEDESSKDTGEEAYLVTLDGKRKKVSEAKGEIAESKKVTQLSATVQYIKKITEELMISRLSGPWLPPIEDRIFINKIIKSYNFKNIKSNMYMIIGMYDDPSRQYQGPLIIDLENEGNVIIFGSPSTGKTTMIKTMIMSLSILYTPNEINIYIMDFGGMTLNIFKNLPHVGGVVLPDNEDRIVKLILLLSRELESRKRSFADKGISSLAEYNRLTDKKIPAIVVFIDNFVVVKEQFDDILDSIQIFIREGINFGIYLCMTTTNANDVSYKITQNIKTNIALQLNDKMDYNSLIGKSEGLYPAKFPGRGLFNVGKVVEFQTALPVEVEDDMEITNEIRNYIDLYNNNYSGKRAKEIPVIPETMSINFLLNLNDFIENFEINPTKIPLGLDLTNLNHICFDFSETHYLLVAGTTRSGKSMFMKSMIEVFTKTIANVKSSRISIIETESNDLKQYKDYEKIKYISKTDEAAEYIKEIVSELNIRKRSYDEQDLSLFSYVYENYPLDIIVMDNFEDTYMSLDEDTKISIDRIIHFGFELGVLLVASCNADYLKTNRFNGIFEVVLKGNNILVLGGSPEIHNYIDIRIPYQLKPIPILTKEAYWINPLSSKKIKVVTC